MTYCSFYTRLFAFAAAFFFLMSMTRQREIDILSDWLTTVISVMASWHFHSIGKD